MNALLFFPDKSFLDCLSETKQPIQTVYKKQGKISSLLNQTAVVYPAKLIADGDLEYYDSVKVPCRIDYSIKRVLNQRGQEMPAIAMVYMEYPIQPQDRITLPNGMKRTAISVNKLFDGNGNYSHVEVYV